MPQNILSTQHTSRGSARDIDPRQLHMASEYVNEVICLSDISLMKSRQTYLAGQILPIQINAHHDAHAHIISVFEPFTLSCAMVVELDTGPRKNRFVLKLYDRRFATQLRRDEDAAPWNAQIEADYQEFVRTGAATEFFNMCNADFHGDEYGAAEQDEEWSEAQEEAYLQYICLRTYKTERYAYEQLRDIQGKSVPRIFAYPFVQALPGTNSAHEYLDCPGLLMEYIQGFPLTNIADHAPKESWQYICEEAIRIVHEIGDRGICNRDVKTRSFIIRQATGTRKYQVFMTDFGHCSFRSQAKDDREFRSWQADQDEEGAVGLVMERHLMRRSKGGFEYHRSSRASKLRHEFKREDLFN